MPIILSHIPPAANAKLQSTDTANIISALSSVVTLPEGQTWDKVVSLYLNVSPEGSSVFNVKFKE